MDLPTDDIKVMPHDLMAFCVQCLLKAGLSPEAAETLAEILVDADLRNVHTHGVTFLPRYARGFMAGTVNKTPSLRPLKDNKIILLLDGDNGIGHIVCKQAMLMAIDRAKEWGICVISIRNSNHFGAAAYFPMMAAREGMIGYITTNAPPVMAAWGGKNPVLSNNPFAYAFPTSKGFPIVLDMACSTAARGKIRRHAEQGKKIPLGWAMNRDGEATEDAAEAFYGALLPVGDHKGYGMALINEVLAGALSGSRVTSEFPLNTVLDGRIQDSWQAGHLIFVFNIDYFVGYEQFLKRVDKIISDVKGSQLARNIEQIYLPGERGQRAKARALEEGIHLSPNIIGKLNELALELGIGVPDWAKRS